MLVPIVVLLDRLGSCRPSRRDLDEARDDPRDRDPRPSAPTSPRPRIPAKQLARSLHGRHPPALGRRADRAGRRALEGPVQRERQVPGVRPRCCPSSTTTRSSGSPACRAELQTARSALVMLRDPRQHRQVQRRFDLTRELVEIARRPGAARSPPRGRRPLARTLDLGDAGRLRLALPRPPARGRSGPGRVIERLKGRLAETGYGRAQAQSVRGMRVRGPVRPEEIIRLTRRRRRDARPDAAARRGGRAPSAATGPRWGTPSARLAIRGAPAIGIAGAMGVALAAPRTAGRRPRRPGAPRSARAAAGLRTRAPDGRQPGVGGRRPGGAWPPRTPARRRSSRRPRRRRPGPPRGRGGPLRAASAPTAPPCWGGARGPRPSATPARWPRAATARRSGWCGRPTSADPTIRVLVPTRPARCSRARG